MSQRTACRILEQATWGPTLADAQNVQKLGFDAWFLAQVNAPLSTIPDEPALNSSGKLNAHPDVNTYAFFSSALYGKDQLRQRVAFALSEIWVVSDLDLYNAQAFPPILRLFQKSAFGNYFTLMKDITLNPAMGHYLDMANNNKGNPAKNTAANENYARELMQLFTLGLNQLNQDGSPVLDAGGQPRATYTQDTVANLAKVFTGWTYAPVKGAADRLNNPVNYAAPMTFHDGEHDMTAKTIFGVTIPAGQTAAQDADQALNIIFNQPTIAPFISKQMIQHLVTSNPSPAYISRVAGVFINNGAGVRGDMKAVIYQILNDPEARAGDTGSLAANPDFGHFREPVLYISALMRGLNANLTATSNPAGRANAMGQLLFYPNSVFNYFQPDYQTDGITAPELEIYDSLTSTKHAELINTVVFAGQIEPNTKVDLTPFTNAASSAGQTQFFTLVNSLFFHAAMSPQLAAAMNRAMAAVTTPADKAKAGLYIALTSSEFLVIH